MTKLELYLQAQAERKKREENIKELQKKLTEAKDLLQVIKVNDFNSQQERREVLNEISRLQTFIDDEARAYKATFENESEANAIIAKWNLT